MTAARHAASAPRPALPAPASARPRFKRLNVDLAEGDHRALKRWALDASVDASALVRALLILAGDAGLRTEAEVLARQLVDERKGRR